MKQYFCIYFNVLEDQDYSGLPKIVNEVTRIQSFG